MLRNPQYIAFALALALALALVSLPAQTTSRLKLALSGLFLPLVGLSNGAQKAAETATGRLLPKSVLLAQNDNLQKENDQMRLDLAQLGALRDENARLRQALQWRQQNAWKLRLARVTAREPSNWWRAALIDLGAEDGLGPNMPVLTPAGLVGRVESVSGRTSRILLLGDPNCKVSSIVDETRDTGILFSSDSAMLDQSLIDLTYLSRLSGTRPGHRVVTSGLGGVFPKGILIGQVVDKSPSANGLYLEARVKLAADLAHLETVWVLQP